MFSSQPVLIGRLIALLFKRSHVAAFLILYILRVGTRITTLVGFQQMALAISAATRVAGINRRASREQRDGLRRSAVVPQSAKLRVNVVPIAVVGEGACSIAAHVVAIRGHRARAVTAGAMSDDAVLERR